MIGKLYGYTRVSVASGANNPSTEYREPAVAMERQFRFVVNPRDNGFEPPHVHVWVCNEDVCRIELNGGTYMDSPPPGDFLGILEIRRRRLGQHSWEVVDGCSAGGERRPDDAVRRLAGGWHRVGRRGRVRGSGSLC